MLITTAKFCRAVRVTLYRGMFGISHQFNTAQVTFYAVFIGAFLFLSRFYLLNDFKLFI